MTIADLLIFARACADSELPGSRSGRLARGVLALLDGPALPCGVEVAPRGDDIGPCVLLDGEPLSTDDARGIALALLRAADEAEQP